MWPGWSPSGIPPVTPQEAVTFMLEQKGPSRSDLDDVMGGKREFSRSQVILLGLGG